MKLKKIDLLSSIKMKERKYKSLYSVRSCKSLKDAHGIHSSIKDNNIAKLQEYNSILGDLIAAQETFISDNDCRKENKTIVKVEDLKLNYFIDIFGELFRIIQIITKGVFVIFLCEREDKRLIELKYKKGELIRCIHDDIEK